MDTTDQENFYKKFPNLYRDNNRSMAETCMCWGLDVGQGWREILWDLSGKLEAEILKFKKANPNIYCRQCGCSKEDHYGCKTNSPGKCLAIHKIQTKYIPIKALIFYEGRLFKIHQKIHRFNSKIKNWINKYILRKTCYKLHSCFCEKYDPAYPCAMQVKEKFGELRFYMTTETEEMSNFIMEAETLSGKTCERCGQPGRRRTGAWIVTLCDECNKSPNKR